MKKLFVFMVLSLMLSGAYAQSSCTIVSLPFEEGFESVSSGLPDCFALNPLGIYHPNPTASVLYPSVGSYLPHTGSRCLRTFNNSYSDTAAEVPTLIFPELGPQFSMSSMMLEFWAQTVWNTSPYLVVGVMSDPDDLSTFTPVQTIHSTAADQYVKYTVYFSDYSGDGRYIAIKIANVPVTYGQVLIDDILLNQMALCSTVHNLAVQNVYGTDVTINWRPNDLGTPNYYELMLVDNATQVVSTYTTPDTFYTFSDLTYSTQYKAYVSVRCTNGMLSDADSVFFRTLSEPVAYPYSENFESGSADMLIRYHFQGAGINQWALGTAVGLPDPYGPEGAPAHSLYISPDNGATFAYNGDSTSRSYAYFNILFPQADWEYHLSFDYQVQGELLGAMVLDYLSVYMVDADVDILDNTVPDGAALLYQKHGVADWTHVDVILPNVNGTSKQFLFFWNNNAYNVSGSPTPAAVDNIAITGNACPMPTDLVVSDITEGSATVSWTETGSATEWTFYYKPYFDAGSYQQVTVDYGPTVDLSNLTPNTEYLFYVVANCTSESSAPTAVGHFRTSCGDIAQMPYMEDFELGIYTPEGESDYISCWSRSSSDSLSDPYVNNEGHAYSGSHYLDFNYTSNAYNFAVLPELDATIEVADLMMLFQTCHTWYGTFGTLGTLEVGVMTDPADATSFVLVDTIDLSGVAQYSYQEQQVSFMGYMGSGKFIAFRSSNSDYCTYLVDDITLAIQPDCMYPSQFRKVAVFTDSVTLVWDNAGEATSWDVAYGTPGFNPETGGTMVIVDTTLVTVSGLANVTDYEAYVRSDCGDSQSPWVGPVAFTTGVTLMQQLGTDTLTTCEAIICDDGGIEDDHSSFCTSVMVVYPASVNNGLMITGICDIEASGWSAAALRFYEGVGTDGAEIASYTGVVTDIAVASAGPVTIKFTSGYTQAPGFKLYVSCISCTPPSNVQISNIQTNSATVSWDGSADSYSVMLSGDANATYTTTGNSLTLNGLSSASTYQVVLRAYCGTDSSLLSVPISFQTSCDPLTVTEDNPWTEDFEGYMGSGNQPFVCWDRPVVDGGYNSPFVYCGWSASCHSGANSAEFKGSNAMLALPAFTNDIHTLQLSFWATATSVMSGTLDIGVVTDITNPDSFEYVGTCGQPGPRGPEGSTGNGVLMGPFNFSGVVASSGRIALRYNNSEASESWNLDDFLVEIFSDTTIVVDPCEVPTGLHTTNVENHAISIAWDADANVSSWDIQYRVENGSWTTVSSTTNSYDFTDLDALTTYQFRVRSKCGDINLSDWTQIIAAQTTNVGVMNHLENSIALYPNPANEVVNVQCTMNNVQVEAVEVIDVYGKVVHIVETGHAPSLQSQINVSGLAMGMYFVRVTTDTGVVTKTFVKR